MKQDGKYFFLHYKKRVYLIHICRKKNKRDKI